MTFTENIDVSYDLFDGQQVSHQGELAQMLDG